MSPLLNHCESCWALSFFDLEFSIFFQLLSQNISIWWRRSLQSLSVSALWTYIFKRFLVIILWHLRINSSQYKLHLQVIRQILYINVNGSEIWWLLTYSLYISPYKPLMKSSILLQLRHVFFYYSGVDGLTTNKGS